MPVSLSAAAVSFGYPPSFFGPAAVSKPRLILILLLTVTASAAGGFLANALRARKQPDPVPAVDTKLAPVPPFKLTERGGRTVTNDDLKGKVWVASFVFTRCTGPCPAVAATLARLQGELADVPELRLVTFTIDPDRDTPDELKKYADHFRADKDRWLFLTGPEKEIHALANDGFLLLAKRHADGKPGEEFDHSSRIVLVDKAGVIRNYFNGVADRTGGPDGYEDGLKQLSARVRKLAKE
jgi:cytochrome oxidase Cu insertion factor (SCO1/SenC/PrrC family)